MHDAPNIASIALGFMLPMYAYKSRRLMRLEKNPELRHLR